MLAAAASGVMYLVFYTLSFYKMDRNKIKMNMTLLCSFYSLMDTLSDRSYYAVNTKMCFVMAVLLLLYGLNETDSIEVRGSTHILKLKGYLQNGPYFDVRRPLQMKKTM